MPRIAQRQDHVSLRLSPQSKQKLEQAAAYLGKTLTDFIIDVTLQKAARAALGRCALGVRYLGWTSAPSTPAGGMTPDRQQ